MKELSSACKTWWCCRGLATKGGAAHEAWTHGAVCLEVSCAAHETGIHGAASLDDMMELSSACKTWWCCRVLATKGGAAHETEPHGAAFLEVRTI
uniref:Secreted protein n=1 Tax=Haemonchus contortus TaxID=6289 RepID=A0A7I4YL46_HAECO